MARDRVRRTPRARPDRGRRAVPAPPTVGGRRPPTAARPPEPDGSSSDSTPGTSGSSDGNSGGSGSTGRPERPTALPSRPRDPPPPRGRPSRGTTPRRRDGRPSTKSNSATTQPGRHGTVRYRVGLTGTGTGGPGRPGQPPPSRTRTARRRPGRRRPTRRPRPAPRPERRRERLQTADGGPALAAEQQLVADPDLPGVEQGSVPLGRMRGPGTVGADRGPGHAHTVHSARHRSVPVRAASVSMPATYRIRARRRTPTPGHHRGGRPPSRRPDGPG